MTEVMEPTASEELREVELLLEGVEAVGPLAHMFEVESFAFALSNGNLDE